MGTRDTDDHVVTISGATLAFMSGVDSFRQSAGNRLGIGSTGLMVLNFAYRLGPSTAGQLGQLTNLTSGSMTATIDKLVARGYVTRESSRADRRTVLVTISPRGTEATKWALEFYRSALAIAIDRHPGIDTAHIAEFIATAGQLILEIGPNMPEPVWEN